MVFVKTNMGNQDIGAPDTCNIPAAAGAPVPTPLPNMATSATAIPSQVKVLTMCMPNHNVLTTNPMTSGDEAGVMMGVASGMIKGPSRNVLCSTNVIHGTGPVTTMLKPTIQNNTNCPGVTATPGQVKVIVLR